MKNPVVQVLKEQIDNWDLIYRMALFEIKGMYQIHYLGTFWQFLNPAIQIAIYWFVFGTIRAGSDVDGTPYFLWLIIGLIPWFFLLVHPLFRVRTVSIKKNWPCFKNEFSGQSTSYY